MRTPGCEFFAPVLGIAPVAHALSKHASIRVRALRTPLYALNYENLIHGGLVWDTDLIWLWFFDPNRSYRVILHLGLMTSLNRWQRCKKLLISELIISLWLLNVVEILCFKFTILVCQSCCCAVQKHRFENSFRLQLLLFRVLVSWNQTWTFWLRSLQYWSTGSMISWGSSQSMRLLASNESILIN